MFAVALGINSNATNMKRILTLFAMLGWIGVLAQNPTGIIRGTVIDGFTKLPLEGANVVLIDSLSQNGTICDQKGVFSLDEISVGRQSVAVSYMGYKLFLLNNIIVSSGKEVVLTIELEEDIQQLAEVTVKAKKISDTKNSYAYVSGRPFNVEDTERYTGTNGDPARMATYFAGVMAAGDTRNDIIIRGNSPLGLLWRVEGVDIPNPSHFASMGTNGGAMSILNNNQLANSDFMSGAFPSQYGNALSGVFDLNLRNGNSQKREATLQMGSGGLEAGIEGFFTRKSDASYLINYRYSFLELFEVLGINLDIPAIPKYQDVSFKLSFPTKSAGRFSLWGLGGKSSMSMNASDNSLSATSGINTRFGSDMGVVGISHSFTVNENTYIRTNLALTGFLTGMAVDSVLETNNPTHFYGNSYSEWRSVFSSTLKHRINARLRFETGFTLTGYNLNYNDSVRINDDFIYITNNTGNHGLLQSFLQFEYRLGSKVKLSTGVHFQHLNLNRSNSAEPRLALNFELNPKTSMYMGQGIHSQIQTGNVYFHRTLTDTLNQNYTETNRNLGMSKSFHSIAGLKHSLNTSTWIKVEAYHQYLFNIPIEQKSSAYSTLNYGADYYSIVEDSLVNNGIGRNIGVEFTLERTYSKGFYYLVTLSLYDSKYRASDGLWRNTMFNGNYIANVLGGYEFKLPKNESLAVNANLAWAGGLRYIPIDIEKSIEKGQTVLDTQNSYKNKQKDFFKLNIKLIYRINRSKYSYETGFGVSNITNRKNVLMQSFDKSSGSVVYDYQMGLMPEGLFRIYF